MYCYPNNFKLKGYFFSDFYDIFKVNYLKVAFLAFLRSF